MIAGIGCDIIEVARMKKELSQFDMGAGKEIFTEFEIADCSGRRHPEKHFAVRFAAKEALLKALAVGKTPDLRWQEIEIRNNPAGRPFFVFSGGVRDRINDLLVGNVLLTMSCGRDLAMAAVILESK